MADHYAVVAFCPHCGAEEKFFALLDPCGPDPAPGDLTLCDGCGTWLAWNDNMELVPVSEAEMRWLATCREAREIEEEWARRQVVRLAQPAPKRMQ